jgi:hypothetical protein
MSLWSRSVEHIIAPSISEATRWHGGCRWITEDAPVEYLVAYEGCIALWISGLCSTEELSFAL